MSHPPNPHPRGQRLLQERPDGPTGDSVASSGPQGDQEGREAAPSQPLSHIPPSGLIFYDTKVTVMNRVLNATVQRTADHAAPEITLDPLEIVGGEISYTSQKMQAVVLKLVDFSHIRSL